MVKNETKHICNSVVMDLIERHKKVYGTPRMLELSDRITDLPFEKQFFLTMIANQDCEFQNEDLGREMVSFMYSIYYECYINNTYYVPLDEKKAQQLSSDLNTDINIWAAFLNAAISNGMIDKDLYEKESIITSGNIQDFYVLRSRDTKIKPEIPKEHYLLTVDLDEILRQLDDFGLQKFMGQ